MNLAKQKQLAIEYGHLKIKVRALEDRLEMADKLCEDKTAYLAVVCLAFKKYIKSTNGPFSQDMSDEKVTEKLNLLVKETVDEINAAAQEKCRNVK